MAELKTKKNDASVDAFLNKIENEKKRIESYVLNKMFINITKKPPAMWGASIIGYGDFHYVYKSGREGDWMLTGFSPRKTAHSIYIMSGLDKYANLLEKLGKHKRGKGCLYIKTLEDIDLQVLNKIITQSISDIKKMYSGKN